MDKALVSLVWLHVLGNIVWIGAILAVGVLVASPGVEAKTRGTLARTVYMRLAVPAFVLSFVCGLVRLLADTSYYLRQHHWMHGKLPFALAVIALHHIIGGRAKKMASGAVQEAGPTAILTWLLLASAALAAFFAIFHLPD